MQDRLAALVRIRWPLVGLGLLLVCGGVAAAIYELFRAEDSPIIRYPAAIAVSDTGELFVFSEWSRVRVFSSDGQQLRSWRVDTLGGTAVLAFEQAGVLAVATARNDRLYRFSPAGELLSSEHDPGALERIGVRPRGRVGGPAGERYEISGMSILRREPTGDVRVIVPGVPALLRPFFFGGLPPIVFAVQGAVVLVMGAALVAQKARFERDIGAQGVAESE